MSKKINVVFFGNFGKLIWEAKTNEKISKILKDLNLNIGKSINIAIEIKDSIQTSNTIEKPKFYNQDNSIELVTREERIDFNVNLQEDLNNVSCEIKKYYEYLYEIIKEFDIKINRIGVSYYKEGEKKLDLSKHYLNLSEIELKDNFGLKESVIEKLKTEEGEEQEINVFAMIETKAEKYFIVLDVNTVFENNNKVLKESIIKKFEEEAPLKIENIIKKTVEKLGV